MPLLLIAACLPVCLFALGIMLCRNVFVYRRYGRHDRVREGVAPFACRLSLTARCFRGAV